MTRTRIYRRTILTIIAGVMTISLFVLTLSAAVLIQFGIENIALGKVTDEDYYLPQSETITERVRNLTGRCQLPEEIVTGVFDSEEILAFTKAYTMDRLRGFDSSLQTDAVFERLRANLYNYMEEHEISMASLDMDALNSYLNQAVSLYTQAVNSGLVLHYHDIRLSVLRPAIALAAAALLLIVCCLFFMYRLTGMRRKVLSYTIRALLAEALLCTAYAFWHFIGGGSIGNGYSPGYMEALYIHFEDFFFLQFAAAACIWLLAAAGCAMAMEFIRHRRKK